MNRGWLEAGFPPRSMRKSQAATSSSDTVAVPVPTALPVRAASAPVLTLPAPLLLTLMVPALPVAAKSMPEESTRATGAPVAALSSVSPLPCPRIHAPPR